MLNFAMFGAGRIANVHGQTLSEHPDANLKYVVDPFPDAAMAVAKKFQAKVVDADVVFADSAIDAVLICSPTDTHSGLIEKAALAGKAIFCEKPVDLDIDRARHVADIIKETGVLCFLGFNRRFDPTFNALYQDKQAGRIGNLEQLVITSRDPSPPPVSYIKVSGGLFRDMMIHDLDMARWMLGEEPVEVHATGSCLVDPAIAEAGDIDSAMVTLKTASGKLCHINNSRRAAYGYDQRIELLGEKGMLQAANHKENEVRYLGSEGDISEKPLHFFLERYMPAYRRELQSFVDSVTEGNKPDVSIDDGVKALELADACYQSLKSGQTVYL
ncbi:inositol 2-dehydrogenase [Endozoicomonas sp. OPT23]|uniref:inositol 2-dehydrogenase n=1 Tax=Endozoicomonas sp. OPT23 TaxID=2072845 RepID=UPI00129AE97E|nr:inositol 2-dehydrogenase [Endozoicomonas sp. OPT23]MRI33637.1 inositol 2-dehydrogenase [Endozoicomonas sp. OPT23]